MEEVVCVVCAQFEPQTWRKSLCKNCFHTDEEHIVEDNQASPVTEKSESDIKQKSETGDKTSNTGNEKQFSSKSSHGSKQTTLTVGETHTKTFSKSATAALSSRFGLSMSKGKDNDKTDNGKSMSKSTAKPSSEVGKRMFGALKETTDVKTTGKKTFTGIDKRQNGIDIKVKPFGAKDTVVSLGQISGDAKTGDVKASFSSEAAQVSKPDNPKSVGSSSRYIGTGAASKVKHPQRSYHPEDELADAHAEKKTAHNLDQHATRTDSDVTEKCHAGEGNHVTSKTLLIGKERDSGAASVVKTAPVTTSSNRSVKSPSSRSEDGDAGPSCKSPSVIISLRGAKADIKLGKTDTKSKLPGKFENKEREKEKALEKEIQILKAKEQELLDLKAKEKQLLANEKEFNELKAREHEIRELKLKERDLKAKEKEFQILLAKEKELEKLKYKEKEIRDKENEIKNLKLKEQELRNLKAKENEIKTKEIEIRKQEENLSNLKDKLVEMEKKCKKLEQENSTLKRTSLHGPKEDAENMLAELRQQLSSMESRCMKLESDNTSLMTGLKEKEEAVRKNSHGDSKEMIDLRQKFRDSEKDVSQVEDENIKLKSEIRELREEMDEMYDTFRENEVDEFRDLQKELEITAKNCRILQFKLRKAERRNEQVESDKTMYEERLRILQNQFESVETRAHIRKVEEELKMAKEVSVRLHDELDLLEDKKIKAEEDSRHLTELLEQADKKQFRMEMEIDKLRDQIMDLKQELKYAGKQNSSDRKAVPGTVDKPSSGDYDGSQVMRDLYDSIERENDLKEQLRFTEEETKMMRKKLAELEEENEGLNMQIRKMSRNNRRRELKEKERFTKESEENESDTDSSGEIDLKIQCELLEQELTVSRKKISDTEQNNENLRDEVQFLQEKLEEKTQLLSVKPEPSSPNAYYEDKIKQMTVEADDLKWKVIEKEREIERLCAQMNFIQHSHRQQQGRLKKSKSLDSDLQEVADLRKQLDQMALDAGAAKERLALVVSQNESLVSENERLKFHRMIPSIQADDAAVENIELKDKAKRLEDDNRSLQDKIKTLTESLQTLTKDTRSRSAEVLSIPENRSLEVSRDSLKHLESLQAENNELRRKMAEYESARSRGSSEEAIQKTDDQKAVADDGDQAMDKDPEDMTRLQLVEKVLDLEDEILDLKSVINHKELDRGDVEREVTSLKQHIDDTDAMWRKKEREMVEEMEMMHEKNSVLSNLLEIVTERADRAEQEIEILMKERISNSDRSASQVSALSNASVGSDDVFLSPPPSDKTPIIYRDWDKQMKKRVESLERLLAEERLKVATAEKKLLLVTQETISTAMSDDSKLHLREKELLQHELIESQKHLKIATDQIKGTKERLYLMEEEHKRLKIDYGRVCEQLDHLENSIYDFDKTPEGNIEYDTSTSSSKKPLPPLKIPHRQSSLEGMTAEQKCAMYKLKAEELQYKIEEISDIWRSKSAASEEEKQELEAQVKQKNEDIRIMGIMLEKIKDELCEKEKAITISEATINEKLRAITRRDEILQEQDECLKKRNRDLQTIMEERSNRDQSIKELREAVRNRDERLKEKDDILCKLNQSLVSRQRDVNMLSDKIKECSAQLGEKESVISVLQQQISHNTQRYTDSETDVEKVNTSLKESLRCRQSEIEDLKQEKYGLVKEIDTSRRALDEAMLLWEKDKVFFESTINIADEKLKLYETLPSMNKQEIVASMESDAQQYFKEKEKLSCDLLNVKKEHKYAINNLKEQHAKLQTEINEKGRQLDQKLEIIDKQKEDLERLSRKAEMAYKLQQDERVMRAEYLAVKVRYETRFEKMSKDYTKLMVTTEKLQKERDLDKAIIQGIQKSMTSLKDNYSTDLVKWEDEKARLERHIKEIDETRDLAEDLRKRVQDLKEQLSEQDLSRTDMVNKFATERSSWDIERANLRSKINQMDEKLSVTSRAQTRAKDIHSHMELAWEKERAEQKRLLEKAHTLALDLQEQLKSRDEYYRQERRNLLRQLESEQQAVSREKKERDIAMAEYASCGKKVVALQKRNVQLEEKYLKESEESLRNRNDLLRRLKESNHAHAQHSKQVSDILSNLVKLRELGRLISREGISMISSTKKVKEVLSQSEEHAVNVDKNVVKYIKEAIVDITIAADNLSEKTKTPEETRGEIRRSMSSSEIELLKEELIDLHKDSGDIFLVKKTDNITIPRYPPDVTSRLQKISTLDSSLAAGVTVALFSRTSEESPSFSSGTCSAQRSKSTSPDKSPCMSPLHTSSLNSSPISSFSQGDRAVRPQILQKSVSMDATPTLHQLITPVGHLTSQIISACMTPAEQHMSSPLSTCVSTADGMSLNPPQSGSLDRLSPRSARRKFFEERPVCDVGFLSWPERKHYSVAHHKKQSSLPDPSEVRKVAEEDYSLISKSEGKPTCHIKSSLSWDEKMHYRVIQTEATKTDLSHLCKGHTSDHISTQSDNPTSTQENPTSLQEKRCFFKKSSSLDGPIGSSLAKIGAQAMPIAAPTGFMPTDIFSTMRGKFKLPFTKSKEPKSSEHISSAASYERLPTTDSSARAPLSSDTICTPSAPFSPLQDETGRSGCMFRDSNTSRKELRWRSKSAEQPEATSSLQHQSDVILANQVWQFSETAV